MLFIAELPHKPGISMTNHKTQTLILASYLLMFCSSVSNGENWPRFRGPNGEGKSNLTGVPTNWTEDDYEWRIDLPGKGHSSPSVWGDHLFLMVGNASGLRSILCFNSLTGEQKWSDSIQLDANHLHKKNSYGSGTPATDGEHVYAAFADEQHYVVNCYSMDGKKVWTRDLGTFTSQHGQGVSPIIHDGLVIVPNDQMGPSLIVALDTKTGKTKWTTEREFRRTSYATPMIIDVDGRPQLITLCGALGLSGIDPKTGVTLWDAGEMPQRTVASPVFGAGVLIATSGAGGRGKHLVAITPGADADAVKIHATRTQNLPYVPTPIVHEGHLFLWNDDGIVCCIDLSGDLKENVWRERIGGNFSGSPVLIDGKLYCISEDGEVAVIDASPTFKSYGKSPIGDFSYATPAVGNGRVYLRGFESLVCLKAKQSVTSRK